jgi:hypothetical protein
LLVLTACAPSFVDQPWLVTSPRLIAVVAEPPEVAPAGQATLTATLAGQGQAPAWSRCDLPAPLGQNEPVSSACVEALGAAAPSAGDFALTVPAEACARFGPDVTSAADRPRDADATGGWYQPIGVSFAGQSAFAFERLTCDPSGVTLEVANAFRRARTPNHNPTLTLGAQVDGRPVAFDALPVGQRVTFVPTLDEPETFALIDPGTFTLASMTETRTVQWFVTDGVLDLATTRAEPTSWHAPADSGQGTLWGVARDSRGGVAVVVQPLGWR